jgi:hypothetical protein
MGSGGFRWVLMLAMMRAVLPCSYPCTGTGHGSLAFHIDGCPRWPTNRQHAVVCMATLALCQLRWSPATASLRKRGGLEASYHVAWCTVRRLRVTDSCNACETHA